MGDNVGGDKHPPDNGVEKESLAKVGQIYREDYKGNHEPGFFKILRVKDSDDFNKIKYSLVRIDVKTKKRLGSAIDVGPIRFRNKYSFVAENEAEFSGMDEELILGPEDQIEPEPPTPGPESEPERGSYSALQIESVVKELLLSNEKVKKIDKLEIKGGAGVMALHIEMSVKTPPFVAGEVIIDAELKNTNEGIIISNYKIDAGSLVKSALEKELVPRLTQISTILSEYIEKKSGKKVTKIEIGDTGELVAIFDSQGSAPIKTKITPPVAPEPGAPTVPDPKTPGPDLSPEPTEPLKAELTPEQKKRAELGGRLGLSPEQLAEREQLEAEADRTRAEYVTSLYEHEQSMARVLSILSLKRKVDPDAQYKTEYTKALEALQNFDIKHLQDKLTEGLRKTENHEDSVKSYIERYTRLEAVALWSEQQDIKVAHKDAHVEKIGGFGKTILEKVGELVKSYEKLDWKKKIAIGGGLFVGHMGLALISGPAAVGMASLWLGTILVTGTAAYKGTSKMAETAAQRTGDKLGGYREKREVAKIGKQFREGLDEASIYFDKLNTIARESIKNSDKKLKSYERRSFWAKAASMTLIFGTPAARFLGDIFGAQAVAEHVGGGPAPRDPGEVLSPNPNAPDATLEGGPQNTSVTAPEGNLTAPPVAEPSAPESAPVGNPPETPSAVTVSLESATVTPSDQARGLWGIISHQLPENMPEAERNRVTGAVENLIRTKLEGLTDAQIHERYGFSTRDINLIHEGETIRLDALVSRAELQEIINGDEASGTEVPGTGASPDAATAAADTASVDAPDSSEAAGVETLEQREAATYTHSNTVGFASEPPTPVEQYWQDVRNVQGNATGPYYSDDGPFPGGGEISQELPEVGTAGQAYTVEMSDYRQLLQDHAFEGRDIPMLQRESITLLNQELWDIDNTEFGPDHQFTNMNMQAIERQYNGRPIQELLSFDNDQYNQDPRIEYRQREWELRNREIYLPPMNPSPTLTGPPDAYAIATMDQVRGEYRHNIGNMARTAIRIFGTAAIPQNSIEHQETVREYMGRIATLYTRARLENPNFRLNF